MSSKCSFFVTMLISVLFWSTAQASNIAVFPIEDLTYGANGVNFELTAQIASELKKKDFEVISGPPVVSFLARNRIRWVGFLETGSILSAGEDLSTDLLLFGTSFRRRQPSAPPAIGLTLYLVRTSDARVVWTHTGSLSPADEQHILGLNHPETVQDLMPLVVRKTLASFPVRQNLAAKPIPVINIEEASINPKYVRSGERVSCSVLLRSYKPDQEKPQVFVKAGNRVHLAMESTDSRYYEASWQGDSATPGQIDTASAAVSLAMQSPDQKIYSAQLSNTKDGRYPVTLIVNLPDGEKKVLFLGSYQVDSTPPELALDLKGTSLNGVVTFRDKVLILPRMTRREPISRWKIQVTNADGKLVMSEKGKGNLPRRLIWNGRDHNGNPAKEGVYTLSLTAWDRAGNQGGAEQHVRVARMPPELVLTSRSQAGKIEIKIDRKGTVPIAFWRLELWSADGVFLKNIEGEELPAAVEVPSPPGPGPARIECSLLARDILGNQTKKQFKDLGMVAQLEKNTTPGKTPEKKPEKKEWVEEF